MNLRSTVDSSGMICYSRCISGTFVPPATTTFTKHRGIQLFRTGQKVGPGFDHEP